jgi:hypothetical protein
MIEGSNSIPNLRSILAAWAGCSSRRLFGHFSFNVEFFYNSMPAIVQAGGTNLFLRRPGKARLVPSILRPGRLNPDDRRGGICENMPFSDRSIF